MAVAHRQRSNWPTVSSVSGGGRTAQAVTSSAPARAIKGRVAMGPVTRTAFLPVAN